MRNTRNNRSGCGVFETEEGRNLCDGLCVERKIVEDRIVPKLVFSLFVCLVSFVVEIAIGRGQRIDEIYEGFAAMMRRCV